MLLSFLIRSSRTTDLDDAGYKLGIWVQNQRQSLAKLKDSVVRDERIQKLNSIQFEWTIHKKGFVHHEERNLSFLVM